MFNKIQVSIDGSEPAKHALEYAAKLAERDGAELVVLSVVPSVIFLPEAEDFGYYPQLYEDVQKSYEKMLEDTVENLQRDHEQIEVTTVLKKGDPARNIVETSREQGVDLIVVGNRGTGGIVSWMLGSVSRNVAEACTVPVLIVKDQRFCEVR